MFKRYRMHEVVVDLTSGQHNIYAEKQHSICNWYLLTYTGERNSEGFGSYLGNEKAIGTIIISLHSTNC